ncbi:MAG: prepilin peptidase [Oscillospiraceae bacterium]|nr:prepilin peptidase [Oscillospiraceae bacterium]
MQFEVLVSIILLIYGSIIGSFLNVVIYRTPQKEQVVKGRSHCMSCEHTLAWYDLFPIFSWVFLGGKCRYCKVKISGRYAFVELLCGISYIIAFLVLGFTLSLLFAVVLFPVLICLAFLDLDTGEIEYWCPLTIAGLGLVALVLSLAGTLESSWHSHLLGAVVVSVPFAILAFFGAMGGADVQLMAAAGLLLGWNIVPAAFTGIFLGAIVGIIIKLRSSADSNERIPDDDAPALKGTVLRFGPCLAIGIAVGFLYGDQLINWYFSLMSVH